MAYLDGLPPQDEETLGSLLQEARELVYQDVLDLVGLLDLDADAHRVDGRLDEHALVLVTGDGKRGQQDFWARPGLDLGDIVTLGGLGCEVGQAQGGGQTAADSLEVRSEGLRLEAGTVNGGKDRQAAAGHAPRHTILRIQRLSTERCQGANWGGGAWSEEHKSSCVVNGGRPCGAGPGFRGWHWYVPAGSGLELQARPPVAGLFPACFFSPRHYDAKELPATLPIIAFSASLCHWNLGLFSSTLIHILLQPCPADHQSLGETTTGTLQDGSQR